jgi:HlyD family secretion protein
MRGALDLRAGDTQLRRSASPRLIAGLPARGVAALFERRGTGRTEGRTGGSTAPGDHVVRRAAQRRIVRMKNYLSSLSPRALALGGAVLVLLTLFAYGILRAGPLAPVPVTVTKVEERSIAPALFGIGTVEARYTYLIGPTAAGKLLRLDVDVGDAVRAGQVVGEMDPVDLNDRIGAQRAAIKAARANVQTAEAQLRAAAARNSFAQEQVRRYEGLLQARTTSEETLATQQQALKDAQAGWDSAVANLAAARQALDSSRSNLQGLIAQRVNLNLVAPVAGLVTARDVNPGSTVVAGSPVVEMVDPKSLWVNVRFDQLSSAGLRAGLPVRIVLRSRSRQRLAGHVLWVDPLADSVTEETLAKVVFDRIPQPLPPLGELAEATVALPAVPAAPVIPNASIQRIDGEMGVWRVKDGSLRFVPVKFGARDLSGRVQVLEGLEVGEQVVDYSQRALTAHSRIRVVRRIPGVSP